VVASSHHKPARVVSSPSHLHEFHFFPPFSSQPPVQQIRDCRSRHAAVQHSPRCTEANSANRGRNRCCSICGKLSRSSFRLHHKVRNAPFRHLLTHNKADSVQPYGLWGRRMLKSSPFQWRDHSRFRRLRCKQKTERRASPPLRSVSPISIHREP